jgi:hypothetical protein
MSLEKLLCMNVAAALTQAAVQGQGSLPNIDPTIQDAALRAKDLEVWEVQRIFYTAVVGALQDGKSWPEPTVTAGTFAPSLVQSVIAAVTPLLSSNPALAGVLAGLQALIPKAPTVPTAPLPNPGGAAPAA